MNLRLVHTEITPFISDYIYIHQRHSAFFQSPFHAQPAYHSHPELELVFIQEGFGSRIIGNTVEPFKSGDMVFVGPNVPHLWLSDHAFYDKDSSLRSKSIVTYFNPKIFQEVFNNLKEFSEIKELIRQASKGIRIFGETRSIIGDKLIRLSTKTGFEKVEGLLQIMQLIATSTNKSFIEEDNEKKSISAESDRLIDVIHYIQRNIDKTITLKQVAEIACLTEQSFCRFFRSRMKITFSDYLIQQRMSYARKLLITTNKSISEISDACGYKSSSHFCKIFKEQTGQSPFQFKRQVQPNA
jgi:AraC-like DNA-binding protein